MRPEDIRADKARPFTGAEFLESLRRAARSISTASAWRMSPRIRPFATRRARIARLYDALHDPKTKDVLTSPTDTGSGGYTHRFFRPQRSRDELSRAARGDRGLGADDLRLDGPHAGLQGGADEHARRQCRVVRPVRGQCAAPGTSGRRKPVLFMNHAIVNPPVDRHLPADQVKDVFVTIAEGNGCRHHRLRRQGGGDVGGVDALQLPRPERRRRRPRTRILSVMFIVPMDAPGIKLFCRISYEQIASTVGTPFDYPLSSVSTRTMRSSCSTTSSSPGRTCWCIAMRAHPDVLSALRLPRMASASRAAPALR